MFKIFLILMNFLSLFCLLSSNLLSKEEISIILTSNLEGKFSFDEKDQEINDPFLLLAQNLVNERANKKIDLYFDLGNAFYPGAISKYSYGSIVMDFFNYFSCDAELIASKDLLIGIDNLNLLQTGNKTKLLSANIIRDKKPVFTPYLIFHKNNTSIAVIGLSSKKILFDIAEQNLYKIQIENEVNILTNSLKEIAKLKVDHIILLSGLNLMDTMKVLSASKQIDLAICGGDNIGELYSGNATCIELADSRSILMLPEKDGFYWLDLIADSSLTINSFLKKDCKPIKTNNENYKNFLTRLTIWKQKFKSDESKVIANIGEREYIIDDLRFDRILQDKFNAEIAMVNKNTINRTTIKGDVNNIDILNMINQDYNIFIYYLSGDNLNNIIGHDDSLIITGTTNGTIQGYAMDSVREYRIVSPQASFERTQQILNKNIPFQNTWINTSDIIVDDLQNKKIACKDEFSYLERKFRFMIDFYLSNILDFDAINSGASIPVPPGEPSVTYQKWGLENRIDFTFYNRWHQFVITPYMYYVRQDVQYLNNQLQGTFLYTLNLSDTLKPYAKFEYDTVVSTVDGQRPSVIRETQGANFTKDIISGSLGIGFEKNVWDPDNPAVYGIETIINLQVPLLKYITYNFNLDSFISLQPASAGSGGEYLRSQIANTFSAPISKLLSVSLKYRFYYYDEPYIQQSYKESEITTSINFKTDFKIW